MNLKPLALWSFLLSLLSYLMCIINAIIAIAMVMPVAAELASQRITDQVVVQQMVMARLGGGILTVISIMSWVAIIIGIVALILSIVTLVRGKGEKFPGKGLAIAGLVLASVYVGLALIGMLAGFAMGGVGMTGGLRV